MQLFGSSRKNTKTNYTDQDIIHHLKQDGPTTEAVLFWLYDRYFHKVRIALARHKLVEDDVLEVYSEALMALRNQVRAGKFEQRSAVETFFARIFEFKCIDKIRRNTTKGKAQQKEAEKAILSPPDTPEDALIFAEDTEEEQQRDALRRYCLGLALQPFQSRDRDILTDYFIHQLKPAAIAEKYQFKTDRVASTTASNLKKSLKQAIQDLCQTEEKCRILCA